MGKTSMFCKINEKLTDSDVIMEDSKAENYVTKITPYVVVENSGNHMIELCSNVEMGTAESHMIESSPDVRMEISENHVTKSGLDVSNKISNHMTRSFESMLQAKQNIHQKFINNVLTDSDYLKMNKVQNNIKEASKHALRPVPTGLVSEKISVRQP
jgi:hypothetical protein